MDKYKINYFYDRDNDINGIFIKVLNKELKKYTLTIFKNEESETLSSCTQFSQEGKKIVREYK